MPGAYACLSFAVEIQGGKCRTLFAALHESSPPTVLFTDLLYYALRNIC